MPKPANPILIEVSLDSRSRTPMHRQLYDQLREFILDGTLKPGAHLPSTRVMATETGVSRTTVKNRYEQLAAEGYVFGTVGSGTRVSSEIPDSYLGCRVGRSERSEARSRAIRTSHRYESLADTRRAHSLREFRRTLSVYSNGKPFEKGFPALDAFPFKLWRQLVNSHCRSGGTELLGHGDPLGYRPLREALAGHLGAARAVRCTADQILIIGHWQKALELAAFVLLDIGDCVWIEEPAYPGVPQSFSQAGVKTMHIPVDDEGLSVAAARKRRRNARLAVVTPSHQFPLGVLMSLARRMQLLAWASETDSWIIEDDFGSELRYTGRPIPSLQGLDTEGRVIYMGTFNQIMFPALHLTYLVLPRSLVDPFASTLRLTGYHYASVEQAALADFIGLGHFMRHIRRMRTLYAERQATLIRACRRHLDGILDVNKSDAGLHLVAWLTGGMSDREAAALAASEGLYTTPLSSYYAQETSSNAMLLGYASSTPRQLRNAVERLARALT